MNWRTKRMIGRIILHDDTYFEKSRTQVENLKPHYRSGEDDLGQDFFLPCLRTCSTYDRAVGYFSSSVLLSWLEALPRIVGNPDVKIRLLASPEISQSDKEALDLATNDSSRQQLRQKVADQILNELITFASGPLAGQALRLQTQVLAWLIANDRLELRFAFPQHTDHPGIFHEKIGVFTFPWSERVAFTGSANETNQGHTHNYESLDVYRSWLSEDANRVQTKIDQFETAWSGRAQGLHVCSISPSVLARLAESPTNRSEGTEKIQWLLHQEEVAHKWRHQDEALSAFLHAKHGVLEMATGTGKTKTALKILDTLLNENEIDGVVICTDGTDLLDQWRKEIDLWQLNRYYRMRVLRHYGSYRELERFIIKPEGAVLVISRQSLSKLLKQLPPIQRNRLAIVHDEVHGLGSPSMREQLLGEHKFFGYRLGLSATPEREYDEEGSKFIASELGNIIFRFGLKEAIERGILSPFDYYALTYELTDDDRARLKAVYNKEAARKAAGNPMTKEELWTELSKVYKTAEQKPFIFMEFISKHPDLLKSTIIFVETRDYGQKILEIVHQYTHKYRTYYADDDRQHLVDFAKGKIDCIITCHRISQGIDIKHLKHVILFSSARAKLETIQRIGRCIRTDPKQPDKRAVVVDFVRPQDEGELDLNADQARMEWLQELARVNRKE